MWKVVNLRRFISAVLLLVSLTAQAQTDFIFTDAEKPAMFTVPFTLQDSLIKVEALVNGQKKFFLLDNACPYLVMNAHYWAKQFQVDTAITAGGIGGAATSGHVYVDEFNWYGLTKKQFKAVAVAVSHLGDSISGMIGYDVIKDYTVTFDYARSLLSFARSSNENDSVVRNNKMVPFQMAGHLPVIEVYVGDKKLLMGLDCAASQNLIYASLIPSLTGVSPLKHNVLKGAGAGLTLIQEGTIAQLFFADHSFENMKFSFDDNSVDQINQSLPVKIDGLLGYPFLKKYKCAINYVQQVIQIGE